MTSLQNLKLKQRDTACAQIYPLYLPKRQDVIRCSGLPPYCWSCELRGRRPYAEKEAWRHTGAIPWVLMALWLLALRLPAKDTRLKTLFETYLELMN